MRTLRPRTACLFVVIALLISTSTLTSRTVTAASSATTATRIGYIVNQPEDTLHVVQIVRDTVGGGARATQPTVQALGTVGGFKDPVDVGSGNGVAVVADFKRKEIVRIDAATLQKTATMKTGKATRAVAVTPDGSTALVLVKKKNLLVVDVATMTLIRKLRIGKGAEDVVMDDTGTFAATVNVKSKTVSLIDVAAASARSSFRRAPVVSYEVPPDCDPAPAFDVSMLGANHHAAGVCTNRPFFFELFGPNMDGLAVFLDELDGIDGTLASIATHPGDFFPAGISVTTRGPDGSLVTSLFSGGSLKGVVATGITTDDGLVLFDRHPQGEPPGVVVFDEFCTAQICDVPGDSTIFADGFESGDTSAWSSSPR